LLTDAGRRPLSIYVHVPLCNQRCPFCDCYSLVRDRRGRREEMLVSGLLSEIRAWASIPNLLRRPVTTVHFGGGTPNCLMQARFETIVRELQATFAVHGETEWALESTTSLLTEEHLESLSALGFTRLHVGVQTLEDPLRRILRRRETAAVALAKLQAALGQGWVVSVDLIYGLPGQILRGLVRTLERLAALGVHGFSLYQLQASQRNRVFLERHGAADRNPWVDYTLFQSADDWLTRHGYPKNHFAHYARPPDQNLYYRHAVRGEDLLALGPTADGVFGAYHYRHPEFDGYVSGAGGGAPALEGGVAESPREAAMRPAQVLLMAGEITEPLMDGLQAGGLLRRWSAESLVKRAPEAGRFLLTGNGSWYLDEMLDQLARHLDERR
jgi:oxygen-independent coproporphyrinogen-3 oxidase